MSKKIWFGAIVLSVAASSTVCVGQEREQSRFRALLGMGREATPSVAQDGDPIDALREKLAEQLRTSSQALQLLEAARRQLAQETARSATDEAVRRGEKGFRAIYTIDPEGGKATYLTAAPGMISSSSPEVSHDGTMIAFDAVPEVNALGEAHLFVFGLAGPFKGVFKDFGCGNVPSWSPDDKQIAYMLNPGNPCGVEWGIWVMNADGSQRKRLCDGWYPRFSPDGELLHVYSPTNPPSIHVIRPDGRGERKLVGRTMTVKYGGGTWSPLGNRIVFIGTRDGKEHLATVAVDDEEETSIRILYTEEDKNRELVGPPAWSPNGKRIVLAICENADSTRSGRWHNTYLYMISAEVPGKPELVEPARNGLINRSPMWSPDGETVVFSSER